MDGGDLTVNNLRALMPADHSSQSQSSLRNSCMSLSTSSMTTDAASLNDFAIDITHIEKFVHDSPSDSKVLDQK